MVGTKTRLGLEAALAAVGLEFDGRPHRGVDDARNTARLYAHYARGFRTLWRAPESVRDEYPSP